MRRARFERRSPPGTSSSTKKNQWASSTQSTRRTTFGCDGIAFRISVSRRKFSKFRSAVLLSRMRRKLRTLTANGSPRPADDGERRQQRKTLAKPPEPSSSPRRKSPNSAGGVCWPRDGSSADILPTESGPGPQGPNCGALLGTCGKEAAFAPERLTSTRSGLPVCMHDGHPSRQASCDRWHSRGPTAPLHPAVRAPCAGDGGHTHRRVSGRRH
mmetsp:Transcript_3201/g.9717  ORF Transcript_3201/g.9717 Transcript_3201/m.9717 type:complete len:214 (+) Transcript_3201:891-1532(+)